MSKREHNNEQDYIEWLKSLGCVLYLPLLEEGDLQDKISGLSLSLHGTSGSGGIAWNTVENGYVFTTPTINNSYTAILENGMDKTWFPDDNFTTLVRCKVMQRKSGYYARTHCPNYDLSRNNVTVSVIGAAWNGTGNTGSWPTTVFDYGMVVDKINRNRKIYQNGTLYTTTIESTDSYPSNWRDTSGYTGLLIAPSDLYGNGKNLQYMLKNIYLFNTVLDLATIRKIQGYE